MKNFSQLSLSLTKQIDKIDKKNQGIYFTPSNTIDRILNFLEPYFNNFQNILEPSCGSCQFILKLKEKIPNSNIIGIELNKIIYDSIKQYENKNIKLENKDFLLFNKNNKYDLIIGNPPFFVIKKNLVEKEYLKYFDGRPNIFILFIIKSLKQLNKNGILSFILPKNFLNCVYYDKTRKFINENYRILDIIYCNDNYIETQQDTINIFIQNKKPKNKKFYFNTNNFTIFGSENNILQLKNLYKKSTTLSNLGFKVSVGNIVWNQHKHNLTNDSNNTLLIYNSNIKNNKLTIINYKNKQKKNFIKLKGYSEPLLVINRGYGKGSYTFNYCLINENDNIEYLIENHLICIKYLKNINKDNLINLYKKIINSFNNEKTKEFIKLYFNNNAINTNELCNIFPIYI